MKERAIRFLVTSGMLYAGSGAAFAQEAARLPEPEGVAITWAIGIALVVVVCVTAFINPKRSHRA